MTRISKTLCAVVLLIAGASASALAQQPAEPSAAPQDTQITQESGTFRQIELTEAMVKKFIVAQKMMRDGADAIEAVSANEAKLTEILAEIAKKAGFSSFEELDLVASNVTLIMAGIDPETGDYEDPKTAIKFELEEIRKDPEIPADERKLLIEELESAIKVTPRITYDKNIELVKKFARDIEGVLE